MKTSYEWWNEVKASQELLEDWLIKQYRGEATAANRIRDLSSKFSEITTKTEKKILEIIAKQEEKHASWIKELLDARGITAIVENAENRYWKETLPGITDFWTGSAVAAHAEKMRLERIQVISQDETAPNDIREIFKKILVDELFHERMFREMAGLEAMEATKENHGQGMKVLGLTT